MRHFMIYIDSFGCVEVVAECAVLDDGAGNRRRLHNGSWQYGPSPRSDHHSLDYRGDRRAHLGGRSESSESKLSTKRWLTGFIVIAILVVTVFIATLL
jgi:hypothetical protein